MDKLGAIATVKEKKNTFIDVSDRIWDYAEMAFCEYRSAQLLCDVLRQEGFTVKEGVADISTAFTASFGSGKPVLGILGEYDALSGLNQKANSFTEEPVTPEDAGKPGHGCGHNLLGAGALAAAVAVKEYLKDKPGKGTVVFFGCPGEEGGSGKTFMARDGVFDGLDAAITWHPAGKTGVKSGSNLANIQVEYTFLGKASHAAASPQRGRSALDAVELMNMGVQFLREHIPDSDRVHYAITDAGGVSPNVVQPKAKVLYLIRSQSLDGVKDLHRRVDLVAQGAATMTETKVEARFIKACSNLLPNHTLEKVLYENVLQAKLPAYTQEEWDFAKGMAATWGREEDFLFEGVKEYEAHMRHSKGSSDVGDVSWLCPTAQIWVATHPLGTPAHSWQETASGKHSIAHKGMLLAGEVMAGAVIDLLEKPELLAQAKAEFSEKISKSPYECPIPEGVKPAIGGL